MNRRGFIKSLGFLVGGITLNEAIPFGRVWSFPSNIVPANHATLLTSEYLTQESLAILSERVRWIKGIIIKDSPYEESRQIRILAPRRYTALSDSSLIAQPVVNSRSLID